MKLVEFRDGEREVPDHVAVLLSQAGIEPHTMTYDQAVRASESALVRTRLNERQASIVDEHMRRLRF